jgi:uncharacterized protein with beta-barrel porin domain
MKKTISKTLTTTAIASGLLVFASEPAHAACTSSSEGGTTTFICTGTDAGISRGNADLVGADTGLTIQLGNGVVNSDITTIGVNGLLTASGDLTIIQNSNGGGQSGITSTVGDALVASSNGRIIIDIDGVVTTTSGNAIRTAGTGTSRVTIRDTAAITGGIFGGAGGGNRLILDANSNVLTLNSIISGFSTVGKTGEGTVVLGGANTYTGLTTISDGTLSLLSSSEILADILNDATLISAGRIQGNIVNNSGSNVTVTASGRVEGTINNAGQLTNNGGVLATVNNNNGVFDQSDGVTDTVNNTAIARLSGGNITTLNNVSGGFAASGGTVTTATITGGTVVNDGGQFGTVATESGATFLQSEGQTMTLNNNGIGRIAGGVIAMLNNDNPNFFANNNDGSFTATGGRVMMTTVVGGVVTNDGGIFDRVEVGRTSGDISNFVNRSGTTGTLINRVVTLIEGGTIDLFTNQTGIFTGRGGTVNAAVVAGGRVNNDGATFTAVSNNIGGEYNTISGMTGQLDNNGGEASISGGTITTLNNNTGNFTGTGGTVSTANVTNGSVTNNGTRFTTVNNSSSGTFVNSNGQTETLNNSAIAGIASGTISTLNNSNGSFTGTGGNVTAATITGGSVTNQGVAFGTVTNAAAGIFTNTSGNTASLTNAGTANIEGGTVGTLSNSGTVNASGGSINAATNAMGGVLNVTGPVTAGRLNNNGTANLNAGTLTVSGAATNSGILNGNGGSLTAGSLTNVATGQITGALNLSSGVDALINDGRITGSVAMGAGDDRLELRAGSGVTGSVDGGMGNDTLALALGGTEAAPVTAMLAPFTGFETLRNTNGVVSLSGNYAIGAVDVAGGRLIGTAGSTLTAQTVTIANGATYGSAGRVVGNIVNNGTLSPGASPGTMTVTGNVSLNAGSTTLFELTPTVSDQLLISGSLTIANGATLNLTGTRPLASGTVLDLIVADGGINGRFSTVNQSATVGGFVAQRANRIQLLGLFATNSAFTPQVNNTVTYVNDVLVAGQAGTALLNALPSLATSGSGTNSDAFARINPEAYASATQLGLENGIAVSKALRDVNRTRVESGPFTFAQGFGNWRRFAADAGIGTSRANTSNYGVVGGLGIGGERASIAAFIGYADGKQTLSAIGAETMADGVVAGITGGYSTENLQINASITYDAGKANTVRGLPGGGVSRAGYNLRSWTTDISLGYAIPVGSNWAVMPEVGLTHISTKRGAVSETGSAAFDLAVLNRETGATFVEGSLTVMGGRAEGAKTTPWLSIGVRHQADGDAVLATGGFKGVASTFTVAGADRRNTLLTTGIGVETKLSDNVSLNAGYRGEFGKDNAGHNATIGLKIGF